MRDHIRILGILHIVLGSLTAAMGLFVLLALGTVGAFIGSAIASSDSGADAATAAPFIGMVGILIAAFFLAIGLPAIIGGWGLMRYRPWARILVLILSAFDLFHVPLGTALGIYGFWVLLNTESARILESGGAYVTPAVPAAYPNPNYPPPAGV